MPDQRFVPEAMTALQGFGLFALGLLIGGVVNWGIYALAWHARPVSPWSRAPQGLPRRSWWDRVPIVGWFRLRRESAAHGDWFWLRPVLLELACGLGCVGLYWWEVAQWGLLPRAVTYVISPGHTVVAQYVAHVLLFSAMLIASFIDFDEQTIPDSVTVPGTLAALLLAGLWPATFPPSVLVDTERLAVVHPLLVADHELPAGFVGVAGLAWALVILAGWCYALLDKVCTLRRGWWRGAVYLVVSIGRRRSWRWGLALWCFAAVYITLIWLRGGLGWATLFSSLVGLASGGGLIWGVRLVGGLALRMEAMGFGDVTLMAMIGAFLGWQATVIVFFFAPLAALVIAVAQWLLTGRHYIAFGPYLCLAAASLVVGWNPVWRDRAQPVFSLGLVIPAVLVVCLLLMGMMLTAWRWFRERVLGIAS